MNENAEWGIRSFLAPVITRMLIYGTNPFDVETILTRVEALNITSSNMLQNSWLSLWEEKAVRYRNLAEEAEKKGNLLTARELYRQTAQCYYSVFLINFTDITKKSAVYHQYADYYKKSVALRQTLSKRVDIPFGETSLPAYLHLPAGRGPFPCVVIFAGLGSCKEEMDILAQPLINRGIGALIPDMPGCGESLFNKNIKCRMDSVKKAFTALLDFTESCPDIDSAKTGSAGLCMGGGYAYKAAALDKRIKFCVNLFPLFIKNVSKEVTPAWMRQGPFYQYQTGGADPDVFISEMGLEEDERVECPYFLIHGKNDNWMTLDDAMGLYNKASGHKELLVIEDDPVYYQGIKVTHTMPVGEQLHWVKHVFADWIGSRISH